MNKRLELTLLPEYIISHFIVNQFSKQIAKYGNFLFEPFWVFLLIETVTNKPSRKMQSYQKVLNRIKEAIFWVDAIFFWNFEIVSRIQESFDHVTGKRELENEFK